MTIKIKTGIYGLDELLGGGVLPYSNILIYGPPFSGKRLFLMQFIYEGLKLGLPGIFVLTDHSFDNWKKSMVSCGWMVGTYEQKGIVKYIDCYSRQFGSLPPIPNPNVFFAENPTDLNSMSIYLSQTQAEIYKKSEFHRLAFHSLSSLLESINPPTIFRFLQFMIGKFRRAGATCFYTLEKGMHDEKDVNMIQHLMDGVIEIEDRKLRVKGFIGTKTLDWVPFEVTDTGVRVLI